MLCEWVMLQLSHYHGVTQPWKRYIPLAFNCVYIQQKHWKWKLNQITLCWSESPCFCAQGNHGILCAVCNDTHGKVRSGKCIKCGAKMKHIIFFLLIVLWTALLVLFLLKSTMFVNDSAILSKNQRMQWRDELNHGTSSLRWFETGIKERNSMKTMHFLNINVNDGKMPSEQLQDVTNDVGVEDDEGKEGVENEEAPSKHHLPRSFVPDIFKVLSALTCCNYICTEMIVSEYNEDGMSAWLSSFWCFCYDENSNFTV